MHAWQQTPHLCAAWRVSPCEPCSAPPTVSVDIGQGAHDPLLCGRDPIHGTRSPGMGRRIALDIARGLHFLHSKKIVHFDLKSANVLLSRDFTAKIADVGLAKIMQQQFLSTLYCVGTFAWAAPEVG